MRAVCRSRWMWLLLLFVGGCGAEESDRELREARLEPVFRIGELDGEAALSRILAVTQGPDGLLYVTQRQVPHVTVFDVDGSVVRRIGRSGSGPGEFTQAGLVGLLGDSLWVSGRNRLAVFEPDGGLVRHVAFRHGLEDPRLTYGPARYMTDGVLVSRVSIRRSMIARGEISRVPILVTDTDGTILDTVALSPVPRNASEIQLEDYDIFSTLPELGGPGHAFAPDGSALVVLDIAQIGSDQGMLEASWIGPRGDTLAVRNDTFPRRPFPSSLRDEVVGRLAGQWAEVLPFTEARVREAADEQISWPEFQPPYTSAVVGADQRLWLRREALSDSAMWEVWTPEEGQQLRVWTPVDLELEYADDASAWGARHDSLDVPFLFRYEIIPTG